MTENEHVGSTLDDLLASDGNLAEVTAMAKKRVSSHSDKLSKLLAERERTALANGGGDEPDSYISDMEELCDLVLFDSETVIETHESQIEQIGTLTATVTALQRTIRRLRGIPDQTTDALGMTKPVTEIGHLEEWGDCWDCPFCKQETSGSACANVDCSACPDMSQEKVAHLRENAKLQTELEAIRTSRQARQLALESEVNQGVLARKACRRCSMKASEKSGVVKLVIHRTPDICPVLNRRFPIRS